MATLDPRQRRELRAKAHHLRPQVAIGHPGLTDAVLHEIDVALTAHELVKIRVLAAERDERDAMLARICEALGAEPVQHLGKLLIVWRPAPETVDPATVKPATPPRARPGDTVRARRRKAQT